MKFHKRLLSALLCVMLALTFIPITAFAGYSDYNEISIVKLTGVNEILTAGKVAQYNKAVDVGNFGDARFKVSLVNCVEAYDNAYLTSDIELEPGLEYYLVITLKPNEGYTFPYDCSDMKVSMDGVAVEAKNYYSYLNSNSNYARALCVKVPFSTMGEKPEYMTDISLAILQQPIFNATPSVNSALCTVPDDAPYELVDAEWFYQASNNGWRRSENFSEAESFSLWITLKAKEGENIRFSNTDHTDLHVSGFSDYTEYSIFRRKDGGCNLKLYYDTQYPATYPVYYDPNGGAFADGSTELFVGRTRADGTVSHMFSVMERDGYNFAGWYTMPDGGDMLSGSSTFTGPTTLYAHWTPCIDEVHIDNLMLPVEGKAPVFTAKVPDGADYEIVSQRWICEEGETGQMISSAANENAIILAAEKEYGQEILLRSFDGSKVYSYYIELQTTNDYEFGSKTKVYINGLLREESCYSSRASFHYSYDCATPKSFEVFDGAVIRSGLHGTAIEALDLRNYVRSKTECTFTAGSEMPMWLSLSEGGRLTGTRPNTAQVADSFTVEVSDGAETKIMTVLVGAVTDQWEIISHPQAYTMFECAESAVFTVETTAQNPTYEWQLFGGDRWYPLSAEFVEMLGLNFGASDGVMTIGLAEGSNSNLDGSFFRCKVTADGITKTSNSAKLTVNHRYGTCESVNYDNHRYTCKDCGATKTEAHSFRYEFVSAASEGGTGRYRETCTACGKSLLRSFPYGSSDNVVVTLDFNGGDLPSGTRMMTQKKYTNVRPYNLYPVRDGFVFQGWATSKSALKAEYGAEDRIFMAESMKLYAVWSPLEIVVSGTPVTMDNMGDVLGDGTVSVMLPSATHGAKLVLSSASLTSAYLPAIERYAAIYTANPIEIVMRGDENIITVTGTNAVGIFSTEDIMLSGSELQIEGNTSAAGIEADFADIGVGELWIDGAKYGVKGDAEFFDGCTYISAGRYTGSDYKAVSGEASLYVYYHAAVSGRNADSEAYREVPLRNAVLMRSFKIELLGMEKDETSVVYKRSLEGNSLNLGLYHALKTGTSLLIAGYDGAGRMLWSTIEKPSNLSAGAVITVSLPATAAQFIRVFVLSKDLAPVSQPLVLPLA